MNEDQIKEYVEAIAKAYPWATEETLQKALGEAASGNIKLKKLIAKLKQQDVSFDDIIDTVDVGTDKFYDNAKKTVKTFEDSIKKFAREDNFEAITELAHEASWAVAAAANGLAGTDIPRMGRRGFLKYVDDVVELFFGGADIAATTFASTVTAGTVLLYFAREQNKAERQLINLGAVANDLETWTNLRSDIAQLGLTMQMYLDQLGDFGPVLSNISGNTLQGHVDFVNMVNAMRGEQSFAQFGYTAAQTARHLAQQAEIMRGYGEIQELNLPTQRRLAQSFVVMNQLALTYADMTGEERDSLLEARANAMRDVDFAHAVNRNSEIILERFGERALTNITEAHGQLAMLLQVFGPDFSNEVLGIMSRTVFDFPLDTDIMNNMTPDFYEKMSLLGATSRDRLFSIMQNSVTGVYDANSPERLTNDFRAFVESMSDSDEIFTGIVDIRPERMAAAELQAIAITLAETFTNSDPATIETNLTRAEIAATRAAAVINAVDDMRVTSALIYDTLYPSYETTGIAADALAAGLGKLKDAFLMLDIYGPNQNTLDIDLQSGARNARNRPLSPGMTSDELRETLAAIRADYDSAVSAGRIMDGANFVGGGGNAGGGSSGGRMPGTGEQRDTALMVYESFINAGFSPAQARALTGEVHRENSFRYALLFGSHSDPANNANNIGMISWQGPRRDALLQYMRDYESSNGVTLFGPNGEMMQTQEVLNAQAMFLRREMESNSHGGSRIQNERIQDWLANPTPSDEESIQAVGGDFIRWALNNQTYRASGLRNRQAGLDILDEAIERRENSDIPPELTDSSQVPEGYVPMQYNGYTIFVAPDYVQDENGQDYRRFSGTEAEEYAASRSAVLPTQEIAEQILDQADVRLSMPTQDNTTGGIQSLHTAGVRDQISGRDISNTDIIAGHMKDVVQTTREGRTALYGGLYDNGRVIQPFSTVHSDEYSDYSQGVRLIFNQAIDANGNLVSIDRAIQGAPPLARVTRPAESESTEPDFNTLSQEEFNRLEAERSRLLDQIDDMLFDKETDTYTDPAALSDAEQTRYQEIMDQVEDISSRTEPFREGGIDLNFPRSDRQPNTGDQPINTDNDSASLEAPISLGTELENRIASNTSRLSAVLASLNDTNRTFG